MKTANYLSKLNATLRLPVALKTYINMVASSRHFKKNTIIKYIDFIPRELEMIESGSLRIYAADEFNAAEHTLELLFEEDFISPAFIPSLSQSGFSLHFLEDSVLTGIEEKDLGILLKIFPEAFLLLKRQQQGSLERLYQHIYALSALKSEERYRWYEKQNRNVVYRTIQKYLSSFLGMDIKTLSRIRAKENNK